MDGPRLVVKQAHSRLVDEAAAVAELSTQLQASSASLVLFFCSPRYDLAKLGRASAESFAGPLLHDRRADWRTRLGNGREDARNVISFGRPRQGWGITPHLALGAIEFGSSGPGADIVIRASVTPPAAAWL